MLAAGKVRVVTDEHVTLGDTSLVLPDQVAHRVVETAEVHGRGQALRQILPGGVAQGRGEVHRVTHDGRMRCTHEDERHLIGARLEGVPKNFEKNGIEIRTHGSAPRAA